MNEQKRDAMAVPMSGGVLVPANLQEAIEVAKLIAHSGMVPKDYTGNTGAVLVAFQMGAEMGLTPMAAVQNIAVINGRPSLWGDGLLAVVSGHRECQDVIEEFDPQTETATCTIVRRGRTPVTRTFSMADAKKAGLAGKSGPWSQYPRRMLQMRARGFACRDAFPDALRGIRMAEEERDVIDGGIAQVAELAEGTKIFGRQRESKQITPTQEAPKVETHQASTADQPREAVAPKQRRSERHTERKSNGRQSAADLQARLKAIDAEAKRVQDDPDRLAEMGNEAMDIQQALSAMADPVTGELPAEGGVTW